jgi:hypothetical protein
MKRLWNIGAFAGAVAVVATALASGVVSVQFGGSGAFAAPGGEAAALTPAVPAVRPTLVGAAIGQLNEAGGDSATVDLRAAIRDGTAGGALRFFSDEYGYYNGGVRTFVVEAGTIKVTGGGGLFQPDGTRVQVRYDAQFALDGSHAIIHVAGRNIDYTLEGTLDGFVHVWEPPAATT